MAVSMECPNSLSSKKVRQVKSKVKNMLITVFGIKGIVHKEFVLASQTSIPRTTATFYGDGAKTSPQTLTTKELAAAS
jgi:hypothetical protein